MRRKGGVGGAVRRVVVMAFELCIKVWEGCLGTDGCGVVVFLALCYG
jgi:hypothetical protein